MRRLLLIAALAAGPTNLDQRTRRREARTACGIANAPRQAVVIDMDGLPATVADEEDAVVQAPGMLVRNIGIRTFDAAREIGVHEEIENSIDAVRRDTALLLFRNLFGDVIGTRRLAEARERVKHRGPHIGPLLALLRKLPFCSLLERVPFVELVLVLGHDLDVKK